MSIVIANIYKTTRPLYDYFFYFSLFKYIFFKLRLSDNVKQYESTFKQFQIDSIFSFMLKIVIYKTFKSIQND